MDIFDTSKPGNFSSLRGSFYRRVSLNRRVSTKIKHCGYFSHHLDDRHGASPETLRPADIVQCTGASFCMF